MAKAAKTSPCEFFLDRGDDDNYTLASNAFLMTQDVFDKPELYWVSAGRRLADRLFALEEQRRVLGLDKEYKNKPIPPRVYDSFQIHNGKFSFGEVYVSVEFRDLVASTVERRMYYESNHYASIRRMYDCFGDEIAPTFEIVPDTYEFSNQHYRHTNMHTPLRVML